MSNKILKKNISVVCDGGRQKAVCRVEYTVTQHWTREMSIDFIKEIADRVNQKKNEYNQIHSLREARGKLRKDLTQFVSWTKTRFFELVMVTVH